MKGKRDRALLALMVACGLRRHEVVTLRTRTFSSGRNTGPLLDLVGKAGHIRTVPISEWVHIEVSDWLRCAGIEPGKIFRKISRFGRVCADGISDKAIWHIVKSAASKVGIHALAHHDLRRNSARLIDEENVHRNAPGGYNLALLFPDGAAIDKFFDELMAAGKQNPGVGQVLDSLTVAKDHRDDLGRVTAYQHK